jgi:hypothetical protein
LSAETMLTDSVVLAERLMPLAALAVDMCDF